MPNSLPLVIPANPSVDGQEPARLALRPREAAKALGIGERLLWSYTNRGLIPHTKMGKAVLYPVQALQEWLSQNAARGVLK